VSVVQLAAETEFYVFAGAFAIVITIFSVSAAAFIIRTVLDTIGHGTKRVIGLPA
jgi:hypothetical protein